MRFRYKGTKISQITKFLCNFFIPNWHILAAIEAFATIADDPAPYEAFIKKWNGTLKIYQDILDRRSKGKTKQSEAGSRFALF